MNQPSRWNGKLSTEQCCNAIKNIDQIQRYLEDFEKMVESFEKIMQPHFKNLNISPDFRLETKIAIIKSSIKHYQYLDTNATTKENQTKAQVKTPKETSL